MIKTSKIKTLSIALLAVVMAVTFAFGIITLGNTAKSVTRVSAEDTLAKTYTFDDGVALSTDWTVTQTVPSGGGGTCEITSSLSGSSFASNTSTNYLGFSYLNKSGITRSVETKASYTNISKISMRVVANDNSKPSFAAYIVTDSGDVEVFAAVGSKDGFGTGGTNK